MALTPPVRSADTGNDALTPSGRRAAMLAPVVAVAIAQAALVFPSPTDGLIQTQFHATASQLTWVSAIFFLPASVLELTFGAVGDLFGRKRLLAAGCFIAAAGDLIGALSPDIAVLLAGQVIAGIGAAAIFPTSLTMLAQLNPGGRERANAVAQWTMGIAVGASGGPLLAGAIGLDGSVRPAFGVVAALGLLAGVTVLVAAADSRSPEGRRLDLPGQVTIAVALTAILYGVIQGAAVGWDSAPVIAAFIVGVVFLGGFVVVESRTANPMLNLSVFRIPAFTGSALVALVSMCGFLGAVFTVSIRVTVIQGQDSWIAGLITLIVNLIPFCVWPVFGRILYRMPVRWLMALGLVCLAAGQAWVSQLPITAVPLWWLAGPLLLIGIGFNAVVSTMSAATVNAVPQHLIGMASGATNLVRDFGQAIGVAIIGAIAAAGAVGQLPGLLARAGLDPRSLGIATAIMRAGGPVAVAHASIGPASAKTIPAAQQALWHGYSTGLLWCCAFSLVALIIAVISMRPATRVPGPEPIAV